MFILRCVERGCQCRENNPSDVPHVFPLELAYLAIRLIRVTKSRIRWNHRPNLIKFLAPPVSLEEQLYPGHHMLEHPQKDDVQIVRSVQVIWIDERNIPENVGRRPRVVRVEPLFERTPLPLIAHLVLTPLGLEYGWIAWNYFVLLDRVTGFFEWAHAFRAAILFHPREIRVLHVVGQPAREDWPALANFSVPTRPQLTTVLALGEIPERFQDKFESPAKQALLDSLKFVLLLRGSIVIADFRGDWQESDANVGGTPRAVSNRRVDVAKCEVN